MNMEIDPHVHGHLIHDAGTSAAAEERAGSFQSKLDPYK